MLHTKVQCTHSSLQIIWYYYKFESPSRVLDSLLRGGGLSACPFAAAAAAALLICMGDFLGTFGDCLLSNGLAGFGGFIGGEGNGWLLLLLLVLPLPPTIPPDSKGDSL